VSKKEERKNPRPLKGWKRGKKGKLMGVIYLLTEPGQKIKDK